MSDLTIGLLSALLATNQPQAVSNVVQQQTGISVTIPNPNDPAERELRQVMEDDDAALAVVDQWIQTNNVLTAKGAGESSEELNQRIRARLDLVRKSYDDYLKRYPNNARGHLAYGTFLDDIGQEDLAAAEFESASKLDPKNPAAWNNLANYYGENGPLTNAFVDYARAIALNPGESVYYQNLATAVYLYRKDAKEFYGLDEQQVFDKALALYQKATQLDPDNFALATDYAESYYGIKPLRTNDALVAWTNALNTAHNEFERESVFIHLARVKLAAGRFDEVRAHLDAVTNSVYAGLKSRLERNLVARENGGTNSVAEEAVPNAANPPAAVSTNIGEPTNASNLLKAMEPAPPAQP